MQSESDAHAGLSLRHATSQADALLSPCRSSGSSGGAATSAQKNALEAALAAVGQAKDALCREGAFSPLADGVLREQHRNFPADYMAATMTCVCAAGLSLELTAAVTPQP